MAEGRESDDEGLAKSDSKSEPPKKRSPIRLRIKRARRGIRWELENRTAQRFLAEGWLTVANQEIALAIARVVVAALFKQEYEIEVEVFDEHDKR
jgi:hypothetical protein